MNLKNIVIILSRPEEARNIGSVCRAMANSSLHSLRIIGEKDKIDTEKVKVLSIHAYSIFENAEFFSSIKEATSDCVCSFGTTRRRGKKRKGKLLLPEELAKIADRISSKKNGGGKVAIVFGNERTGLEDEELLECTAGVTIPASEDFGSLNLSHAVQIIGYTLFRFQGKEKIGYTPITQKRLDLSVETIADSLQSIGFFSVMGRKEMKHFWKDILSRAALSEGEAQYIEKVFNKVSGLASKNRKE